jgi:hypothetical protein
MAPLGEAPAVTAGSKSEKILQQRTKNMLEKEVSIAVWPSFCPRIAAATAHRCLGTAANTTNSVGTQAQLTLGAVATAVLSSP